MPASRDWGLQMGDWIVVGECRRTVRARHDGAEQDLAGVGGRIFTPHAAWLCLFVGLLAVRLISSEMVAQVPLAKGRLGCGRGRAHCRRVAGGHSLAMAYLAVRS